MSALARGLFAAWRFKPEGADPSPPGWYFIDPREPRQIGPFETRRQARNDAAARRKAWGLYIPDAEGNRVVHIDGPFCVVDRIDSRDWLAGAVEAGERFVVLRDGVAAIPDDGHRVETLREALSVIECAQVKPSDHDDLNMARFPAHARPFCAVAYEHGFEDGANSRDETEAAADGEEHAMGCPATSGEGWPCRCEANDKRRHGAEEEA